MMISRTGLTALRRAGKPSTFFTSNLLKAAAAASNPQGAVPVLQARGAATAQPATQTDADAVLAAQRRRRPVSPHLTIYNPEGTFFTASIWQRFTGGGFTGAFYGFSVAYLAAPLLGWHLESASLAAAFGTLPLALKGGVKLFVAWPFVYHLFNGIKHLVFDLGIGFAHKTIPKSAWFVWGTSLVSAAYLAFLY